MNNSLERFVRAGSSVVNKHLQEVKSLYSLPSNNSCGALNGTELGDDSLGGIPHALTFSFTIFLGLVIAFGFLQKDAFDSGRELIGHKWSNLIFRKQISETNADNARPINNSFWGLFSSLLGISDEMMLARAGVDAVMYLRLTRHLTGVLGVWCVLCLGVALPVNLHGDLDGGKISFGETTLHNLRPEDPLLWVLVCLQLAALPLVWLALRMYLRPVCAGAGMRRPRTLMVSRLDPSNDPQRNTYMLLETHFREAHPGQPVVEIQVARNVDRLVSLEEQHERAADYLRSARDFRREFGVGLTMWPSLKAKFFRCCSSEGKVKAEPVYAAEELRLRLEVASERRACAFHPIPVAFVTFRSADDACAVWEEYAPCATTPTSSAAMRLAVAKWCVDIAPDHRDIIWDHLDAGKDLLSWRFVGTNLALFIITFFLTTPALVFNLMDRFTQYFHAGDFEQKSKLLTELLPTIVLYGVAEFLPLVIAWLDESSHHWTRPEQHASVMAKTFAFLVLMVLVLPSLGLTSVEALLAWLLKPADQAFRWDCIFLPDKGALYVNYVITAAFIGCGMDLVRLPAFISYHLQRVFKKSEAEVTYLHNRAVPHFPFGEKYAWTLLIFTMTMANGVSCPLIAPAGLVYMVLRQVVDRHNLYHTFARTRAGRRLHATAARSALAGVLLLQLSFAALAVARHRLDAAARVSFAGAIVTAFLLVAHLVADSWFGYSLVAGKEVNWALIREQETPGCYQAPSLLVQDEEGQDLALDLADVREDDDEEEEEAQEQKPLLSSREGNRFQYT